MRPGKLLLCFLTVLLCACGRGGQDSSRPPLSLLLISIDTCRPDHLGCYGYDSIKTPSIDSLAAGGIRFARAAAAAPITLPSHSTMLTGLYPTRHGVRDNGTYRLTDSHITLAERLREEGYRTAAFVGAFVMESRFGLAQGFDLYDDEVPSREPGDLSTPSERPADQVAGRAVRWLREEREEPFFLFVHFFDPHMPLTPPEPFRSEYSSLYDAEIAFVDREIGKIIEELDRLGLSERTLVILTGDHGEGLGEHGEDTHAVFVYESTIRIPLVFRWPDHPALRERGFSRGTVVESQVREVDILPTALELLGLSSPPGVEGTSLLPLFRTPEESLRLVNYAESLYPREALGWSDVRSISTDRWKYIRLPREELYDLIADPDELRNLAGEMPDTLARLRSLLEDAMENEAAWGGGEAYVEIDEETRVELQALGYLAGDTPPEKDRSHEALPDPKDRIGGFRKLIEARALIRVGRTDEGLDILRPLHERAPENLEYGTIMGVALIQQRRYERAEEVISSTLEHHPDNLNLLTNLAVARLYSVGPEAALPILESVLTADSLYRLTNYRIAECYRLLEETAKAEAHYRRELEIDPASSSSLVGLGQIAFSEGKMDEAESFYREAIRRSPEYGLAYFHLGALYERTNRKEEAVAFFRKAIGLDPDILHAYYNLAVLAEELGQNQLAWEYLRTGLERGPGFPKFYSGIGNLLREEGRHEEAITYYLQALELDPSDPSAYLHLGVAHARIGEIDRAVDAWREAIELAPDSATAQKARANIAATEAGR